VLESRLFQLSRLFAFALLIIITLYGVFKLINSDWTEVTAYWKSHSSIIPLLVAVSIVDVALECMAWMWVYHRFGIKVFDRTGALAFLSGRAGLLMPAQLGRLIRPDAMLKQKRTTVSAALKAEAVLFGLDGISVVSLLAGLIVFQLYPFAAPLVVVAVITSSMLLGNFVTQLLTHTRLELPTEFWWKMTTFLIILVCMSGWIAHGVALHVVVAGLPGEMTLWDSLFFGPGSAVLGVATGLPGGIGATEGFLGASLRIRSIPLEHLAIAVAAFRLITFWMWIPIGWIAIAILRRMTPNQSQSTDSQKKVTV
jgi:uncharacterized membrane protein YbhN (UPF0104 family)